MPLLVVVVDGCLTKRSYAVIGRDVPSPACCKMAMHHTGLRERFPEPNLFPASRSEDAVLRQWIGIHQSGDGPVGLSGWRADRLLAAG